MITLPPALLIGAHFYGLVGVAAAQVAVALAVVVPAYCLVLSRAGVKILGLGREVIPSVIAGALIVGFTILITPQMSPWGACVASGLFTAGTVGILLLLRRKQIAVIRPRRPVDVVP